jgi:hypothetical protein
MIRYLVVLALAGGLAACGEKSQDLGANRSDVPAFKGTGSNFSAPGWKAGDKTSWEQHLKTRTQGQNDYARAE